MGFVEEVGNGSKYLNISKGKISHKAEDGEVRLHSGFIGVPIDLDIKDAEYEGAPYRKVVLFLVDPETGKLYEFGFSLSSGYGNAFACICPNITENRAIKISPKLEKKEGKSFGGMFVSEDNGEKFEPVKWAITNANAEKMQRPEPVRTTIGKGKNAKEVVDYSDRNEYYEKVLFKFRSRLVKATGGVLSYKAPKSKGPVDDGGVTEPMDDFLS